MPVRRPHRVVVEGLGRFPFDMLRYDACYPETRKDAIEVGRTLEDDGEKYLTYRRVTLLSHAQHVNTDRWESYGWLVVEIDGRPTLARRAASTD